jgi:pimeloyl-ACP methyl ester carboxylesterase
MVRLSPLLLMMAFVISTTIARTSSVKQDTVDSGYIDVEGGRIFYEAAGRGSAVVMIHDGLLHRETWNGQFASFAANHRVIRWDRRGYGRSDSPKAPFINLNDLHALMKALSIEEASLIGCSSGSLLAIEFTLVHPDMVSALVLVGPIVSGFGFSQHFSTRGDREQPERDAPVEHKIEYWTSRDPWIMSPESMAARKVMKGLMVENPQNLIGSGSFAKWPGFSCLSRLSEIKVPTLIVSGESDIPDVHAHAGVIQGGIKGSKRVVLSRSGHLVHFEIPEVFNRLVLGFLDEQD